MLFRSGYWASAAQGEDTQGWEGRRGEEEGKDGAKRNGHPSSQEEPLKARCVVCFSCFPSNTVDNSSYMDMI